MAELSLMLRAGMGMGDGSAGSSWPEARGERGVRLLLQSARLL